MSRKSQRLRNNHKTRDKKFKLCQGWKFGKFRISAWKFGKFLNGKRFSSPAWVQVWRWHLGQWLDSKNLENFFFSQPKQFYNSIFSHIKKEQESKKSSIKMRIWFVRCRGFCRQRNKQSFCGKKKYNLRSANVTLQCCIIINMSISLFKDKF